MNAAEKQRLETYLQRHAFFPAQIKEPPGRSLKIAVVIPCFDEPSLLPALQSLGECSPPESQLEIIVVINSSAGSAPEIRAQNNKCYREVFEWLAGASGRHPVHVLHFPDLPPATAGVGLARKIGMDEAIRRFNDAAGADGIIVSLDADCTCQNNYLASIEEHFRAEQTTPGCSIYFEHPLSGGFAPEVYRAVTLYELHLRYLVHGLRYAGLPYAFQTVGSAFAVRAGVYAAEGGMNTRKAGEDFYFLQKIIARGGFTELRQTTVYPSPRPSTRVPFGTGKAVRSYLSSGRIDTYPFQAFERLREFCREVPAFASGHRVPELEEGTDALNAFLQSKDFGKQLHELRTNTAGPEAFRKRFFRWFNNFMAMKYLNYAREVSVGGEIEKEAAWLLQSLGGQSAPAGAEALLQVYRSMDREEGAGEGLSQSAAP